MRNVFYQYDQPENKLTHAENVMQSAKAIDIMVDTWIAMKPLMDFVNGKN